MNYTNCVETIKIFLKSSGSELPTSIQNIKNSSVSLLSSSIIYPEEPHTLDDITLHNWVLGMAGDKMARKATIIKNIHFMHLWHELNTQGGRIASLGQRRKRMEDSVNIIGQKYQIQDLVKLETKLYQHQRVGGRLMLMKKYFGWGILLLDNVNPSKIRDASTHAFKSFIEYITDPLIQNNLKTVIDNSISPNDAKKLVSEILSEVCNRSAFIETLLEDIDTVQNINKLRIT